MTSRLFVVVVFGGWLSACGRSEDASESNGKGASGSAGDAGSAGSPDGSGGGGAAGGGAGGQAGSNGDFDVLSACTAGACTRASSAQLIEGFTQYIDRDGLACVLTALRDRVPGRYAHETDSTFTSGGVGANHVVVVLANGAGAYARRRYSSAAGVGPFEPEPAQRCVLKPRDYFDACLDALERSSGTMDPEAWRCAFGNGGVTVPSTLEWFETCEAESPARCP